MNRDELVKYLQKRPKLCVLATSTKKAKPECSVLSYAVEDDLSIILSTHKSSRKCTYIKENSQVALVFGWAFNQPNIQYEGVASIIEEGEEYKEYEKLFFSANPYARVFKKPETIFIVVKPTWIRWTNFMHIPPEIKEINL